METDVTKIAKFSNLEQVASWIGHTNSIICLQEMSIDLISRVNSALMDHRTTMTVTEDAKKSWLVACNFSDEGKKRLCEMCCSADGNLLLIFVDSDMESMLNELVGTMKDDIANSVVISTANTRNDVDNVCRRITKLFHQLSENVGEFWMVIVVEESAEKWSTSPDSHPNTMGEGSFWVAKHSKAATMKGNANKVHLSVDPVGELENYPATKIHRALYFINEFNDANKLSHHLNVGGQFSIEGIVNMPLFQNAIHTMLSEQVGLLLTFPINNSNCLCQEYSGATANSFNLSMHFSHFLAHIQRMLDKKQSLLLKPPIQIFAYCESWFTMHLLLNMHHMLIDGFSITVIFSSIVHTYNKSFCNKDSDISMRLQSLEQIACPDQFHDVSTEAHIEYWKCIESHEGLRFHDRDSDASLHTNKYVKKTVVLSLHAVQSSALDDLCKRFSKTDHVSRFSLQFCALACTLQQRTGESDVVIGYLSGLKNRDPSLLKNAVSCQAQILIARAMLSNLFSVRQYISKQSKYLYDARTNGFGQLFNSTQLNSPAVRLALMQVVMSVVPLDMNPKERPKSCTTYDELMRLGNVNFDLAFTFCPKKRPVPSIIIDYNNVVLSRFATLNIAIVFSRYLMQFTKAICQDLLQICGPYYSANRLKRNFVNEQNTTAKQPANSLIELFHEQCQRAKSSDLSHTSNSSVPYTFIHQSLKCYGISVAQTNQQSNCCWTNETAIAICMKRGVCFLNVILATVYLGGCYIPLDPGAPVARNNVIVQNAQPRAILRTDSDDRERSVLITTARVHKFSFRLWKTVQVHTDLLCILHTSGTTGVPKGVALVHRGVIGITFSQVARTRSINFAIKLLQSASFLFDLSIFDMFLALFSGACIVFAEDRLQICNEMSTYKLEFAGMSAPIFNNFTRSEYLMISNAQTIIVGGDKLNGQTARYSSRNGISVWNSYGPTEITIYCTSHFVKRNTREITIGMPLQCYELTVLNNDNIPSVIGQLFVKSAGNARGYFQQPHLTDKSFRNAPSVKQSMSIYSTGDTVVQTNDSYFHFIGRKAFQIKLRGYRIELGEIESTIAKHSLVHSCVALPISRSADSSSSDGDISLVAFLVPKSNNNCTRPLVSSVRETCQNFLPDYMIPSEYIIIASIPFTFNGKIDRRELEAMYREHCTMRCRNNGISSSVEYTSTERIVKQVWAELLKRDDIIIEDDFFALGGNSFLLIRLNSAIQKHFALKNFNIRLLIRYSTVRKLAAYLDSKIKINALIIAVDERNEIYQQLSLQPQVLDYQYPLSLSQKRMYFLNTLHQNDNTNLFGHFSCITPPIMNNNLTSLRLQTICMRSKVLTAILPTEFTSDPKQSPESACNSLIAIYPSLDFCIAHTIAHKKLLFMWVSNCLQWPSAGALTITMNHICADALSINLILKDLYENPMATRSVHNTCGSYAEYALEDVSFAHLGKYDRHITFWAEQFAKDEYTSSSIRHDKIKQHASSYSQSSIIFVTKLVECSKLTNFAAALLCFTMQLTMATGQNDICIPVVVNCRSKEVHESLIGCMINVVLPWLRPLCASMLGCSQYVAGIVNDILEHRCAPYEMVVEKLRANLKNNVSVFQDVLLNYLDSKNETNDLQLNVNLKPGLTDYDLALTLQQIQRTCYNGILTYNFEALYEGTARNFCIVFARICHEYHEEHSLDMHCLIEPPTTNFGTIPRVMETSDLYTTSCQLSNTSKKFSRFRTKIQLSTTDRNYFECSSSLLYARLEQQIPQDHFEDCKNDNYICTIVKRDFKLFHTFLGIMRSGHVYVPVDIDYPEERKAFIFKDSLSRVWSNTPVDNLCCISFSKWNAFPSRNNPHDLVYTIYTSGSTGIPKGVCVSHSAFSITCHSITIVTNSLGSSSVMYQSASLVFDLSLADIGLLLHHGCTLIMCLHPIAAGSEMTREPVTFATLATSTFNRCRNISRIGKTAECLTAAGEIFNLKIANKMMQHGGKLFNFYGPTETTIYSTAKLMTLGVSARNIGSSLNNETCIVYNSAHPYLAAASNSSLFISGKTLSRGYLNASQKTLCCFRKICVGQTIELAYDTGDTCNTSQSSELQFIGRKDLQIKLHGIRVELTEVENVILSSVSSNINMACIVMPVDSSLVAFVESPNESKIQAMQSAVKCKLPVILQPQDYITIKQFPLGHTGKISRDKLIDIYRQSKKISQVGIEEGDNTFNALYAIWQNMLGMHTIEPTATFFALGGTSLSLFHMVREIEAAMKINIEIVDIMENPTLRSLTKFISLLRNSTQISQHANSHRGSSRKASESHSITQASLVPKTARQNIVITGWAGQFSASTSIKKYLNNLYDGIDCISRETKSQPGSNNCKDGEVYAMGKLEDSLAFDPDFWKMTHADASMLDPQARKFLEQCYHALELKSSIEYASCGVFAGCGMNTYLQNIDDNQLTETERWNFAQLNAAYQFSTRVGFMLNLQGPAMSIDTACSTSIVALKVAIDSIENRHCSAALVGAASFLMPTVKRYLYEEGMILSKDGYCRVFDSEASGTVQGAGCAAILIEQLPSEHGHSLAIVESVSVNNDGSDKMAYTAPSVYGQVKCLTQALDRANIARKALNYVECHGTGTQLGDAIELTALEQVFRDTHSQTCPLIIGSVKANIGHADKAAGMAGIIKAIEIPFRSAIPPQIHVQNLNRTLTNSKFLSVNETYRSLGTPFCSNTYIGISSFGIGGTNSHCILSKNASYQPLTAEQIYDDCALPYIFSGNSMSSCLGNQNNFTNYILNDQQVPLCMAANSLVQLKQFKFRTAFYIRGRDRLIQELQKHTGPVEVLHSDFFSVESTSYGKHTRSFLYPGQGNIYPNAGKLSYDTHESFRFSITTCLSEVYNITGVNILPLMFPMAVSTQHELLLSRSEWAQLVTFITCYAVKRQLDEWDIKAEAFVGHSFGEYCGYLLHSAMNIVESIKTIYDRGRILQAQADQQSGRMIISDLRMLDYINTEYKNKAISLNDNSLSIATMGVKTLTISGNRKDVRQLCQRVSGKLPVKLLKTSHAFHSCLLEPGLSQIIESQYSIKYGILNIPFSSNMNGTLFGITHELYANAQYWSAQLRNTVYIGNCIQILAENSSSMIEIGPGCSLLRYVHETNLGICATSTLGKNSEPAISLGQAVCNTWKLVGNIDIKPLTTITHQYTSAACRHFPMYHFEKVDCSIGTKYIKNDATGEISPHVHVQQWESITHVYGLSTVSSLSTLSCVAFLSDSIMGIKILRHLLRSLNIVVIVKLAKRYKNRSHLNARFVIDLDPYSKNGYIELNEWLVRNKLTPDVIIHGWLLERWKVPHVNKLQYELLNYFLYIGCYSIYFLQHTHLCKVTKAVKLLVLSNEIFPSTLDVNPAKHAVVGIIRAMSSQMKWIDAMCIDVGANSMGGKSEKFVVRELLKIIHGSEILVPLRTIAISNKRTWHVNWSQRNLFALTQKSQPNVSRVCITGGMGRIALSVANGLSQQGAKWFLLVAQSLNVQTETYLNNCSTISSLAELCESVDVKVGVLMCDVVNWKDVEKLVSSIKHQVQCLDLLIHTSDVPSTTLDYKEIVDVDSTIQPKLHGSVFLINEVESQGLATKTFAMTSSMLLPIVAASEYIAATTAMDSLIYCTELNYIGKLVTINLHLWEPSHDQQHAVKSKQQNTAIQDIFTKDLLKHAVDGVTIKKLFIEALNLREGVQQVILSQSPILLQNILTAQETESSLVKTSSIPAVSSVVRSVFADVLGKNSFTDDQSFFELGGNSFSALMLIAQLKRFTECSINVNNLIQLNTVAKIVTFIQTANEYHKMGGKSLVPFEMSHENNQQYTLIYLHPVGGCLFQTDALSKQICRLKTYSSYGIQFPYAFSNEMPTTLTSLEHLVQTYADEILQDIGEDLNFVFIGHSLGGTLAYELASQLTNRQKSCTSCIIMFDTWAKYTDYKYDEAKFQKFQHKNIQERLLKDHPSLDDALIWNIAKPIVKTSSFLMKLLLQYSPAKSELLVHQFKAKELDEMHTIEQMDNDGYGSNYWEMVTPNVTVHAAQGDHQTMLDDEYVETIANQIIGILNDL